MGVESIEELLRRRCLRYYGQLLRRREDTRVSKVLTMEIAGAQGRRQPARGWKDVVKINIKYGEEDGNQKRE